MRFLHLADVHLDTPFASRDDALRDRLRRASRTAFSRAVDIALHEPVDALLVAGDLFDGERLSFQTERFLLTELTRLEERGVPVVYATGNHDPGKVDRRAHHLALPTNVTAIRSHEPVSVPIHGANDDLVGRVTGVGHETAAESDDLSALLPVPRGDVPQVALLHAQVVESRHADSHDRYAPASLDRLASSGYGYWALGHVHLRQTLCEDPHVVYPGNPQGRHPGEEGPKGVLLVEMPPGGPIEVEFRETGPIRWETLEAGGLEDAVTLDELERELRARWDRSRAADPASPGTEWMVRVVPRGPTPLWKELEDDRNLAHLATELAPLFGALSVEVLPRGLHPVLDPADHVDRQDVIGEVLRLLREVQDGGGLEGIAADDLAAAPDEGALDRLARELLDGAEGEILARMLPDGERGSASDPGDV